MKIALLTSGGDAPGMNSMLFNLIHLGLKQNHEIFLIYDGFQGLIDNNFKKIDDDKYLYDYRNLSGSFIGSSRCLEFTNKINLAFENLNNNNIDYLCIIGGNGSYEGAKLLNEKFQTFFFPATIDNDVYFSEYCIGFSSAIQEIVNQSFKIEKTFKTHKNICFIEVMGRYANDLLFASASAISPILKIDSNHKLNKFEIYQKIKDFYKKYNFATILVIEKIYNTNEINEINQYIYEKLNCQSRYIILGYSQRGADITYFDLIITNKFAINFYEYLNNNKDGVAFFVKNNNIEFNKYKKIIKDELQK